MSSSGAGNGTSTGTGGNSNGAQLQVKGLQGQGGDNGDPPPRKMKKIDEEAAAGSDNDSERDTQEFDEETQKSLEEIDDCQQEIENINDKASEEILKVEQKYNKLRKPFYDKRSETISKISNFWVTAMVNHPQISLLIDEDEEECLHFMNKLEVEEFEDIKSGYRLKFNFNENPFFENDVLIKEFNLGYAGEPKSTCTELKWKSGMDLSLKQKETVSIRKKRGLLPKTFFSWYSDNENPSADEIADIIKDDLWPNPLQYYLIPDIEGGNGSEEEMSGDDEDDEAVVVVEEEEEEFDDDEEKGRDK